MKKNYENCIGDCLMLLKDGLQLYVSDILHEVYGDGWKAELQSTLKMRYPLNDECDVASLLKIVECQWNATFSQRFSNDKKKALRSWINLLLGMRHIWAHQGDVSYKDAITVCNGAEVLLKAIGRSDLQEKANMIL
ncbi:MAG: Swt1 family HEPN domain-containing protein, partial [bacterium]|nr:Swt1 family HEPN domain-containing protein [bacterium]